MLRSTALAPSAPHTLANCASLRSSRDSRRTLGNPAAHRLSGGYRIVVVRLGVAAAALGSDRQSRCGPAIALGPRITDSSSSPAGTGSRVVVETRSARPSVTAVEVVPRRRRLERHGEKGFVHIVSVPEVAQSPQVVQLLG